MCDSACDISLLPVVGRGHITEIWGEMVFFIIIFFFCRFRINFETPGLLHVFFFAFPTGRAPDGFQHAAIHLCCVNPSGLSIVP